jgi:hypothetical protein
LLRLRARGFAPLTRKCFILLFDRMIHTLRANSTSFGRRTFR